MFIHNFISPVDQALFFVGFVFFSFPWVYMAVFVFVFVLMKTEFIRLYFFPANCLQFSSVTQLCPTLCDPMDYSMPGFPVHQQLPELTKTHIHRISDAIQPSHPLSSPSPHALNLSQHQGLSNESVLRIRWPKSHM